MVLSHVYVIARTASGRPTLQHLLLDDQASVTACGLDMRPWSRSFMARAIPEVLCLRCGHGSIRRSTDPVDNQLPTRMVEVVPA